jgi:hypothetical protein
MSTYSELADYLARNVSIESLRINGKEQDPEVNASPAVLDAWKSWKLAE